MKLVRGIVQNTYKVGIKKAEGVWGGGLINPKLSFCFDPLPSFKGWQNWTKGFQYFLFWRCQKCLLEQSGGMLVLLLLVPDEQKSMVVQKQTLKTYLYIYSVDWIFISVFQH